MYMYMFLHYTFLHSTRVKINLITTCIHMYGTHSKICFYNKSLYPYNGLRLLGNVRQDSYVKDSCDLGFKCANGAVIVAVKKRFLGCLLKDLHCHIKVRE